MDKAGLTINNLTKRDVSDIPFASVKEKVLGPDYRLSLVLCGPALTHELNLTYRKKDKATNILSFPLGEKEGEIFINLTQAAAEAKKFDSEPANHLVFLFIHGLLHLKGFRHSSKMESEEKSFLRFFIANDKKHHRRSRHRNIVDSPDRLRTKKRR